MQAPSSLVRRLAREFPDLRLRWSPLRGEWHIEQKVGRAALSPLRISEADDSMIRARDGYAFVMAIRPGDRMPCPHTGCGATLKVPVMETREVVCTQCRRYGRDGRYMAAFYPLDSEMLFEHLRSIDPRTGALLRLRDNADRNNRLLLRAKERDSMNQIEAATYENFKRMVGIQSVGFTGRETSPLFN